MVFRWRCRHCSHTLWAASREVTSAAIESHMYDHHRSQLSKLEMQIRWECPYCDAAGQGTTAERTVRSFKQHLRDHVEPLVESGIHVADSIDGSGTVLVLAPSGSDGADRARIHLHSASDIVIFVTRSPELRLRLLSERFQSWPAWTVVITTGSEPLAGLDGIDQTQVPLEIVQLDSGLGLQQLGQTVATVVGDQENSAGKLSVEFDILPELIEKFDLQTVFKFLHVLSGRLSEADALAQFYTDPSGQSESTINVLQSLFDLTIDASGDTFTSV